MKNICNSGNLLLYQQEFYEMSSLFIKQFNIVMYYCSWMTQNQKIIILMKTHGTRFWKLCVFCWLSIIFSDERSVNQFCSNLKFNALTLDVWFCAEFATIWDHWHECLLCAWKIMERQSTGQYTDNYKSESTEVMLPWYIVMKYLAMFYIYPLHISSEWIQMVCL